MGPSIDPADPAQAVDLGDAINRVTERFGISIKCHSRSKGWFAKPASVWQAEAYLKADLRRVKQEPVPVSEARDIPRTAFLLSPNDRGP